VPPLLNKTKISSLQMVDARQAGNSLFLHRADARLARLASPSRTGEPADPMEMIR
jgi:hypothetical protein